MVDHYLFGVFLYMYRLAFYFGFESKTMQSKGSEKHLYTRKIYTSVNF